MLVKKKINVLTEIPKIFSSGENMKPTKGLLVYFFKLDSGSLKMHVNNIRENVISGSIPIKNNYKGKIELLKYFQSLMSNVYIKAVSNQLVKDKFLWEDELVQEVINNFQETHDIMEGRIKNLKNETLLPLPFSIDQFQEDEISSFVTKYENYVKRWWQIMKSLVKMVELESAHKSNHYSLKTIELIDQYKFKVIQIELILEQLNSTRAQHMLDILRNIESPFYAEHIHHVMNISINLEDFKDRE